MVDPAVVDDLVVLTIGSDSCFLEVSANNDAGVGL